MDDLNGIRRYYAEEVCVVANIKSAALVKAFATVRREQFLGPGPWQIWYADIISGGGSYSTTADDNPRHLYHNVMVAIDAGRSINNGYPSGLAVWIDSLDLREGNRILHVGTGVGYYTAIMAEMVGPGGHVTGIEVNPELAPLARKNLEHLPHVEVLNRSGAEYTPPEPVDAILVNAGATHPRSVWLDKLRPGGRLLLPLIFTSDPNEIGNGFMLLVKREAGGYSARPISQVSIYPCIGVRDEDLNQRLRDLVMRGTWRMIRSVRREPHQPSTTCLAHKDEVCCLSSLPIEQSPSS